MSNNDREVTDEFRAGDFHTTAVANELIVKICDKIETLTNTV